MPWRKGLEVRFKGLDGTMNNVLDKLAELQAKQTNLEITKAEKKDLNATDKEFEDRKFEYREKFDKLFD